jgi:hypothetical protein
MMNLILHHSDFSDLRFAILTRNRLGCSGSVGRWAYSHCLRRVSRRARGEENTVKVDERKHEG